MKDVENIKFEGNVYRMYEEVHYEDFVSFMKRKQSYTSISNVIYVACSLIFFILMIYFIQNGQNSTLNGLMYAALGLGVAILLLPLHESIHWAMFKLKGAKSVHFISFWKKLYFLTVADQFTLSKKDIFLIAAMPFILVSSIGILLLIGVKGMWQIAIASFLLYHTSFCLHDFQLIEYFYRQKKGILLKTDVKSRRTTFYRLH